MEKCSDKKSGMLLDMRKLLMAIGFAKSKAEASRLIKQGAVRIYPPKE